jgi:hypothetical protein
VQAAGRRRQAHPAFATQEFNKLIEAFRDRHDGY